MNATRDPESLTSDERRAEVASVLAGGLLRYHLGTETGADKMPPGTLCATH